MNKPTSIELRLKAEAEYAEMQALFSMQHRRVLEAEQLWRECNPGNKHVMPDLGRLVQWLVDDRAKHKADADRLAEALTCLIYTSVVLWDQVKCIKDTESITVTHPIIQAARAALAAHEDLGGTA